MDYIKVKDKDNLFRDPISNGIINNDIDAYDKYVQNYKRQYSESQKIRNLENDMNEIRNDLDEIKNLLRNLKNGS